MAVAPTLPKSLRAWRDLSPFENPEWYAPWESLRTFFMEKGYDLFGSQPDGQLSRPRDDSSPALHSFDLYGDRTSFVSRMGRHSLVTAARDSLNRDVVIKLVAKGREGLSELEILRTLNSEPLKSVPANLTVRVLEYLQYRDWQFVVMPFYDACDSPPFACLSECFDFMEQLLQTLEFLRSNDIAHNDITHENIMMNHHGHVPWPPPTPPVEFRSAFPVKYFLIDFGYSEHLAPGSDGRIKPVAVRREQCPPEMSRGERIDPFAADVYSTARLFYGFFEKIVPLVPGLLELLQDMSSFNPTHRVTAAAALDQLKSLKSCLTSQDLSERRTIILGWYPQIPRGFQRKLFEIISTGQVWEACSFMWTSFKGLGLSINFKIFFALSVVGVFVSLTFRE